jgi:hypothetical protein
MYSQWKKNILRRSYSIIRNLPRSLRDPILRSQLHISYDYLHGVEIKIAETKEEFEQAYKLLHDTYKETNLIEASESGLRVTKYHSLPTTSVIIVKHDGRVIGTMSVIQDNALGLPIDHVSDISHLRKEKNKIAEISSLAICKNSDFRKGKILFPLTQYLHRYCDQIGIDTMVCVVNQSASMFYESILLFEPLEVKVTDYNYVNAKEIYPITVDLGEAIKKKYKKIYGNKKPSKNLYLKRYIASADAYMKLPKTKFNIGSKNTITKQNFNYFFKEKSNILNDLNEKEKFLLHATYVSNELRAQLPEMDHSNLNRKNMRFPVYFKGNLAQLGTGELHQVTILESSIEGFGIKSKTAFKIGDVCSFNIQVNEQESICLKAEVCWANEERLQYGFKVKDPVPSEWIELHINLLEEFYPDIDAMELMTSISSSHLQAAA